MPGYQRIKYSRARIRSMRGSNMLEGAVALVMVIGGLIVAGLLLMNSGVLIYNQEKIGYATHSAASFAATANSGSRQADTEAEVDKIMDNLGLGSATTSTTIRDVTIKSKPAVSVTITANLPTMMAAGFGNIIPQQVTLTETAVALKPINPMKYLVVVHPLTGLITLPLVHPTGILPNDGLPAWEISLAGVRRLR